MSVDMQVLNGFIGHIENLGDMAQPTDMSDADRVNKAKAVFKAKLSADKGVELETCVHCGMCAEACHFYESTRDEKYVPIRKLDLIKRVYRREISPMRFIYRLFTKDITAQDLEDSQELVYDSCTECMRCGLVCPMGINIAAMVNTMRQALAEAGLIPAELRAMEQEQSNLISKYDTGSVFGFGNEDMEAAVKQMQKEGLHIPLNKEKADVMVLTTVVDFMLFKDVLMSTIKIMNKLGLDWTFRSCAFEGANFGLLSGDEVLQATASNQIVNVAVSCGAKTVILPECGHSYPALRWEGAEHHGKPLPFEALAISEFIGREVKSGNLKLKPIGKDKKITFHDPCKVGRWGGVFDEPREVFKALDVDFKELPSHGVNNWCCGGGAGIFLLNSATHLRNKAFGIKINQVNATGADSIVTSCASCRLNFLRGKMNANWDKNIESLAELVGENLEE